MDPPPMFPGPSRVSSRTPSGSDAVSFRSVGSHTPSVSDAVSFWSAETHQSERQRQLTDPTVLPHPAGVLQPSVSLPAMLGNAQNLKYLEVVAHPRFEEVMHEIFAGRQLGDNPEKQRLLTELQNRSLESIRQAREEMQQHQRSGHSEIDVLLESWLKLVRGLNRGLVVKHIEANNACTMFESQIKVIANSSAEMDGPVILSTTNEDYLRQFLKQKYKSEMKNIAKGIQKKKQKKGLKAYSASVLKTFYEDNMEWPYPTHEEKLGLAAASHATKEQVSCFCHNKRERHWKKCFDGGRPRCPEEALEILCEKGILK